MDALAVTLDRHIKLDDAREDAAVASRGGIDEKLGAINATQAMIADALHLNNKDTKKRPPFWLRGQKEVLTKIALVCGIVWGTDKALVAIPWSMTWHTLVAIARGFAGIQQ